MNTNGHSAAKPQPLPLLHRMEERAGERRRVCFGLPLSSVLSPLLRRGERKKKRIRKSLSNMHEPSSLYYEFLGTERVDPAGGDDYWSNFFRFVSIRVHSWFRSGLGRPPIQTSEFPVENTPQNLRIFSGRPRRAGKGGPERAFQPGSVGAVDRRLWDRPLLWR